MGNSLLNYHILDGEPAGDGATLSEIADYYGDLLFEVRPKTTKMDNDKFTGWNKFPEVKPTYDVENIIAKQIKLPTIEEAGAIAVELSPELDAGEQAFFIFEITYKDGLHIKSVGWPEKILNWWKRRK